MIDEVIDSYAQNKERLDALDTVCKVQNAEIKAFLGDEKSYSTDNYKVSKSVQNRDTMDEELLCAKLSNFAECYDLGIIKVQEYVDMSALEDALYKKQLTPEMIEIIEKCRKHKEVVTLRVSKIKKEEEE
jgi:hypothetical protein